MHTVLLVFDIGSSGLRASLMDETLNILRNVTTTYPTRRKPGGIVEQDAADWWMSAVRAMLMLRELVPEYVKRVDAIGICGHMWGCLPMDRDGQALQRAMIYSDTRAAEYAQKLQDGFGSEYFYRETGNMLIAENTLCKSVWLRHEQPEIYENTYKILQAKDYLVYRLTGNLDSTDLSDASYGALVNLKSREYDREFFKTLGLDADKFPTLHTGCEIAGRLTEEAAGHLGLRAGIPVSVGGGTSACAAVGGGTAKRGDFLLELENQAWITGQMDEPFFDPAHRVFNICTMDGEAYYVSGKAMSACRSVNWAQQIFEVVTPRAFDAVAGNVEPGSDGLIYLPYLTGERSPVMDEQAQGVFFGMTAAHKREHFLRAVLEGVACGLGQILDVMREREEIDKMQIIGGGAHSKLWKQIIADICDVTLQDVSIFSDNATSLGAAAAAGVGIGLFRDLEEATEQIKDGACIEPDEANRAVYERTRARYAALYPALKDIMHLPH